MEGPVPYGIQEEVPRSPPLLPSCLRGLPGGDQEARMLPQEGLQDSALRLCIQQLWAKDKTSTPLPSSEHKGPCTVPTPASMQRYPFHLCPGASTPADGR